MEHFGLSLSHLRSSNWRYHCPLFPGVFDPYSRSSSPYLALGDAGIMVFQCSLAEDISDAQRGALFVVERRICPYFKSYVNINYMSSPT
jgi:hypothetical protein